MSNLKPKLVQIVDSLEYVLGNCFQHQLHKTLKDNFDLTTIEMKDISRIGQSEGRVITCLKLKTLNRRTDELSVHLRGREVFVYEQDPWESFYDVAACPGAYERIQREINPVSFLNTSKWWSDLINSKGIPSRFVKMWVLPDYCSYGRISQERDINVGFMGSLHEYRVQGLKDMKEHGVNVDIVKFSGVYSDYLSALQRMKIFVHDEPPRWRMGGDIIKCNSLWGKDVEIISQGAFCLRNREDEAIHYSLRDNPLLLEYEGYDELSHVVNSVLVKDPEEIDDLIRLGVDMIRSDKGWNTVVDAVS